MENKQEEISDSEMWSEHRAESQERRWSNRDKSLEILKLNKIDFRCLSESTGHYRVKGIWDFWPTTGKFYNSKTKQKGRGVFNLIRISK